MFELCSDQVLNVAALSRNEAKQLKRNLIGTEHLLLGLIQERKGTASRVLESLGIDYEKALAEVSRNPGRKRWTFKDYLSFDAATKKTLEQALYEAQMFGHEYIGTEHVLLGLLYDGHGPAMSVLSSLGAPHDLVRQQVKQTLDDIAQTPGAQNERRRMGKRIDYYDDPEAPAANSLVPSVNVFVVNERDEVLMICRTDNGNWAVPGGAVDLGESVPQAAVRETLEETGITCEITGIAGIYSDPKHIIFYTSDGEARQEFSIAFTARPLEGEPTPSDESKEVVWVPKNELGGYPMDRSMRLRVDHFLSGGPTHIG